MNIRGIATSTSGEMYVSPERGGLMIRVSVPVSKGVRAVRRFAAHRMDEALKWRDSMLKGKKCRKRT